MKSSNWDLFRTCRKSKYDIIPPQPQILAYLIRSSPLNIVMISYTVPKWFILMTFLEENFVGKRIGKSGLNKCPSS